MSNELPDRKIDKKTASPDIASAVSTYDFRKVVPRDLDRLATWQSRPHVSEWWDVDEPMDVDEMSDARVSRWIVSLEGRPFAYMQDYTVHGWPGHHFADLPPGSRGIDQYIGEADMIGKGHGAGFVSTRVKRLFAAGAPVVATDPHPDNVRAISVYTRIGFRAFGPPLETEWGRILPMKISR